MSDPGDPYDSEDFEPVAKNGGKRKADLSALIPEEPDEGDDVDRVLAYAALNDFGNGKRLITRFGEELMYVPNIGWFAWDGARWDRERGQDEAIKRGHQISQAIVGEAKALKEKPGKTSEERIGRLFAWSVQTGNMARVHGMLAAAAPYLTQPVDALDADPYLLATPEGTIELGPHCEVRPSRREDHITRVLGVRWNTSAQCPLFLNFLEQVMPNQEMRDFLQRICGVFLTGTTRGTGFFVFWGGGDNGKSTFMNTLRRVLNDYSMSSPVSTFLAKREGNGGGGASPDLARLPGARVVAASEPPQGARLDEGAIKEITGGERMTVRHLNQGFFEFKPAFKVVISTNHRPTIRGTDHGIWKRVRLVPWTVTIQKDKIDLNLEDKLWEEREGILQWMLTGCEEWFVQGLNPPPDAIAAVEEYRADEDDVGEFLKARCEVCPESINPSTERPFEVSAKRLRDAYVEWCKSEGLDPLGGKTFGSKLTGRGIKRRKSDGKTIYLGLHLNADEVI